MSFPAIANPLEGPVEVIASGYIWTEGPAWVGGTDGYLLFSDVPGNAIYCWDGKRTTAFLARRAIRASRSPTRSVRPDRTASCWAAAVC